MTARRWTSSRSSSPLLPLFFIVDEPEQRLGQFHHASVCRVSSDCAGSVTAEGDATCQP